MVGSNGVNVNHASGMWCSGITSASHAEGPGFEPRRLHFAASVIRGRSALGNDGAGYIIDWLEVWGLK